MPKRITITIDETGEQASLSGIPDEAWLRFKAAAKKQFPQSGDDAWAAFLSEVIVAGSGGGDDTVTFFMTDVPVELARNLHEKLQQIEFTWDQFHAMMLRSASEMRLVRMHGPYSGVFVACGLSPETFTKLEDATKHSFEELMGTLFVAAHRGEIKFDPENTYVDATAGQGSGTAGRGGGS